MARWVVAVAVALVAAGAAVGGLLAAGHGGWAALGGSVTGVTAISGGILWDLAREKAPRKENPGTSAAAEGDGPRITIRQTIGRIDPEGKVHALHGKAPSAAISIVQKFWKVGRGAEVSGVHDPGSPDQ